MWLLIAIVVGIAVGAAVGYLLFQSEDHLFMNIVFGLAGSVAGVCLIGLMQIDDADSLFNWPSFIGSILGSGVAVGIFNGLHILLEKRTDSTNPGGQL